MPFDYGFRLNNRQRIANAKPIEANKSQSVDGAEGLFLGSGSPQNVYLLPQRQNFRLERCPRPKQIYDHPNNEPDKISHPQQHRPILGQLLVRLSLRQGQASSTRSAPFYWNVALLFGKDCASCAPSCRTS
jgi:hypothetical protein